MVLSKAALEYWRSELLLLAGARLEAIVKREIDLREREVDELLDVQEYLIAMTDAEATEQL